MAHTRLSQEKQAAATLKQRPNHLSEQPANLTEVKKMRDGRCNLSALSNHLFTHRRHSKIWSPKLTFRAAVNVAPHNPADLPELTTIYSKEKRTYGNDFRIEFYCYRASPLSNADLALELDNDSQCVFLKMINSHQSADLNYRSRKGSLLIQLAIEWSIHNGFDGRLELCTLQSAVTFYEKLGFVKTRASINDWDMYLPEKSIKVWKEKIRQHPLTLTEQEIADLEPRSLSKSL